MYSIHIKRPYHKPDFYIKTSFKELYDILLLLHKPFISEDAPSENAYRMEFTNSPYTGRELEEIENALYGNSSIVDDFFALHSAVVTNNGKAYIFCGHTCAGKTTLTSYLNRKGLGYYSDDIALISKENLLVRPYSRPVFLREGGARALKAAGVDFDDSVFFEYSGVKKIFFPISFSPDEALPVGGILFIERTADTNSIEALPKNMSFPLLLNSMLFYIPVTPSLIKFVKQLCEFPIYRLKYKENEMDFVKKCLNEI